MTTDTACQGIVARYVETLSGGFEFQPATGGCYIVTPFTRPDGEAIELALSHRDDGGLALSDMGDTLGYLYVNGLRLTQSVLGKAQHIARRHGVSLNRAALAIEGADAAEGEAVHQLIQAALEVTALIQGRRSVGRVVFDTEVESFIIQSGAVYDVDYKVRGERETHSYKFYVNSARNLLIQPISAASPGAAHAWAERWSYRFSDTTVKDEKLRPMAVLDDRGNRKGIWTPPTQAPISGMAILWEERGQLLELLTG